MTTQTRVRLLGGLLALWAILSVMVFGLSSEPQRVPLQNVTGLAGGGSGSRGEARHAGLQVNVTLFEAGRVQRAKSFSPPKNIFWGSPSAPGAAPALASAPGAADMVAADAGPNESMPAGEGTLRYLGFVEAPAVGGARAVAVLAEGEDLHMVRAGERVGAHLVLREVAPDHVRLFDTSARREQRLPLVDIAPSEPAS